MNVQDRPTFETLFRKAAISQNGFSRIAKLDVITVRKARNGENISELSALKLLKALNSLLGTNYELEDINWKFGTQDGEENK